MTAYPWWLYGLLVPVALMIGACAHAPQQADTSYPTTASTPADTAASTTEVTALRQRILQETLAQLGRPYRYGGGDGSGFDCSGLALHVYADVGIDLPRTAAEQSRRGRGIASKHALPGDLMFFRIDGGDHVVVYIGDGRAVHSPAPGRTVTIANVGSDWWQRRLRTTRRMLPD